MASCASGLHLRELPSHVAKETVWYLDFTGLEGLVVNLSRAVDGVDPRAFPPEPWETAARSNGDEAPFAADRLTPSLSDLRLSRSRLLGVQRTVCLSETAMRITSAIVRKPARLLFLKWSTQVPGSIRHEPWSVCVQDVLGIHGSSSESAMMVQGRQLRLGSFCTWEAAYARPSNHGLLLVHGLAYAVVLEQRRCCSASQTCRRRRPPFQANWGDKTAIMQSRNIARIRPRHELQTQSVQQ